ncbi:hypothetical protein CDD83_34 [Cordyceps sp. RAO-2017]|nr:hypothetical protein CDD83_34 [Cordyceps sp. RAO-2017]
MSKPGFAFGLNRAKKQGAAKPAPKGRSAIFGGGGGDNDSDDDAPRGATVEQHVGGDFELENAAAGETSSSKGAKAKGAIPAKQSRPKPMYSDLSSSLTSRKNAEAAQELDPTVYEYDSVYDSLKPGKAATTEDVERKPKYMRSLMQAAEVRKRDALIAEEKKIARERAEEGDEFADKEKFVTEAYKKQQEENRRIEEEERRREEEEAKKNEGGGMSAFYRRLLDKDEQRHAEALQAAQRRAKDGPGPDDEPEEEDRDKAEAALARELNEKGGSVALNEDGQVVDKRQLLKGGLNVGAKKKEAARTEADRPRSQHDDGRHHGASQASRKQAMRQRQSRMLEEQLEQATKRSREADDAQRQDVERAAKSRKTEGDISSARERYLARKRAAEEAKANGLAED